MLVLSKRASLLSLERKEEKQTRNISILYQNTTKKKKFFILELNSKLNK